MNQRRVALAGSVGRIEVTFREMCPKCRAGIMMKFRFVACHLELQVRGAGKFRRRLKHNKRRYSLLSKPTHPQFKVEALFNGFLIKTYFIRRWCCLLFIRMHQTYQLSRCEVSSAGISAAASRTTTTRRPITSRMLIWCCRCLQDGRRKFIILRVSNQCPKV